ncbi:MAG: serine hydrolase domain-containing protein [Acidobacteriota bacterium]
MMRFVLSFLSFLTAAAVFGSGTPAVDFSGRWIVNLEETGIPGLPVFVLAFVQSADSIEVSSYFPGEEETPGRTMVLPLDGREVTYADRTGKALPCSASLSGGELRIRYQSEQVRKGKKVVLQIEEDHTIADDGRSMSVVHREGPPGALGAYPRPIVLDRYEGALKAPGAAAAAVRSDMPLRADVLGSIDAETDALLRRLVAEGGVPSASAAVISNGKLVWAANYNGPAGLLTRYSVGSITKPFTAVALLQLLERDLLDLDADVGRYLPFKVRHPQYPDVPITTRMLLTHQSGLNRETQAFVKYSTFMDRDLVTFGARLGVELPHFERQPSAEEFYGGLLTPGGTYFTPDVWADKPGTLMYSNAAFGLLTYLVERLTGETFEAYVEKHIFAPLAMNESSFSKTAHPERNAPPCERAVGPALSVLGRSVPLNESMKAVVREDALTFPMYNVAPGPVGVRATAADLAKFLAVHMNAGLAADGRRLLKKSTIDMMHAVAAPASGAAIDVFPLIGHGMGWTVCTEGVAGHIGGQLGYTSAMILKKTERGFAGFILLINYARRLDPDSRANMAWSKTYYTPLEQRLLDAAGAYPSAPKVRE